MTVASPGSAGQPKSRNWMPVIIAAVVFCCLCSLCLAVVGYLYGDQIFGLTVRLGAGAI